MTDNGRTDSEKLHFAEQKAMCDLYYFSSFATNCSMKVVFWILVLFFAMISGSFGYTKLVSNDVTAVDKVATLNSDRYERILTELHEIKQAVSTKEDKK